MRMIPSASVSKRPVHELPLLLTSNFAQEHGSKLTRVKLTRDKNMLQLEWNNGETCSQLPSEFLRVYSPSVQAIGHDGKRRLIWGKKYITIDRIDKVGNYALRITFNDGHDTGIFTFHYLWELSQFKYTLMKQYLNNLHTFAKSRYPTARKSTTAAQQLQKKDNND